MDLSILFHVTYFFPLSKYFFKRVYQSFLIHATIPLLMDIGVVSTFG